MNADKFEYLSREKKKQVLFELIASRKSRIGKSSSQAFNASMDSVDIHDPFDLNEIQSSYFVGRFPAQAKVDPVGCHFYHEFSLKNINLKKLEDAFNQVLKRHPELLITISKHAKQFVKKMQAPYSIVTYDLHLAKPEEIKAYQDQFRAEMSHKIYKPDDWPLFDIRALILPGNEFILFVSLDSWIVDAHSAKLLFTEWYEAYHGEQLGVVPKISFKEILLESKQRQSTTRYQRDLKYWIDKLGALKSGPFGSYEEAFKYEQQGQKPRTRVRLQRVLDVATYQLIKLSAKRLQVSPSSLLLSFFVEFLAHHSTLSAFSVVMTQMNRPRWHEDIDKVIGALTSVGVFNYDLSSADRFEDRAILNYKQLWKNLEHNTASVITALHSQRNLIKYQSFPPVVFTSLIGERGRATSWLDYLSYGVSQTPGVYLDHQIYEFNGELFLIWDVVEDAFEPGYLACLFELYCEFIFQFLEQKTLTYEKLEVISHDNLKKLGLSVLQKNYIKARKSALAQVEFSNVYQEYIVQDIDINKLQNSLNQLIANNLILQVCFGEKDNHLCKLNSEYKIVLNDLTAFEQDEQEKMLNGIRMDLSRYFFSLGTWPSFVIQVTRFKTYSIVHICIDMLLADGLSTLLFSKYLFASDLQIRDVIIRPVYRNIDLVAAKKYWEKKISYLSPGWGVSQTKPSSVAKIIKRFESEFEKQFLLQLAQKHNVSIEAILLTLFDEMLKFFFRFNSPLVLVLTDRKACHGILSDGIFDYSVISLLPSMPSTISFEQKVKFFDREIAKDLNHRSSNFIEVLPTLLATGQLENFPQIRVSMTSCLSQIDIALPHAVKRGYGCSYTPGLDFDFFVFEENGLIKVHWDVNISNIEEVKIQAMQEHYRSHLNYLSRAEHWQLNFLQRELVFNEAWKKTVIAWNQTQKEYNTGICLHELFMHQARLHPKNLALYYKESSFSYQQLDQYSNQIAHCLISAGIRLGAKIGICLRRDPAMIAAVLAILKVGAAYVPIDVTTPNNRIERILDVGKIDLVILQQQYVEKFQQFSLKNIVLDGFDADTIKSASVDNPGITVHSAQLAYVIFTSGSTGEPKGVMVKHQPVVNLIEWAQKQFAFSGEDCVLFTSPLSFDLSVFDIFGLLAYGGSINIVDDEQRVNGMELAKILEEGKVSFWNSAPAVLMQVIPFLKKPCPHLRLAFLSGDWIPLALPEQLKRFCLNVNLISLGGATEAAVWSNYFIVKDIQPDWPSIPYGKPIQNARYYIFDDHMLPCKVGEIGNLYIGGECLSSGYIGDINLTQSKFIPDPFLQDHQHFLYYTGDLARFFEDGNIQFLGRADHQVKIRGFRIELGDVESNLQKIGFKTVVAIVIGDNALNRKLICFISSESSKGFDVDKIKKELKLQVSYYMVPDDIYFIESLPLTTNGKVDRKALAEVALAKKTSNITEHEQEKEEYIQFSLSLEDKIRACIAETLEIDKKEIKDDSHIGELGFNSLHYTVLSVKINEVLKIQINPARFFQYVTVKQIARYIIQDFSAVIKEEFSEIAEKKHVAVKVQHLEDQLINAQKEIAIIGLWLKAPGAENYHELWRNLLDGVNSISLIPNDRWDWRKYYGDPAVGNYTHTKYGGFIEDVDKFDAKFFNISPREAELMDPRQRLMLQGAWSVIEDAGYNPETTFGQSFGVFLGVTGDEFEKAVVDKLPQVDGYALTGISRTILPNRISYYFDWKGPSEAVDTACSSSLVAVHRALSSIQVGDCDLALAGGVNIMLDPHPYLNLTKIGMLSPDGQCKAFSDRANGYVRAEGAVWVMLKPLNKALIDQDHIYAVIKESAINHGGRANSLTAPNPNRQTELLIKAYEKASIDPRTIGSIEAHGTGTALGDPIEFNALHQAFTQLYSNKSLVLQHNYCALSSIKSNLGHLEAAAGVIGLVKLALSLKYQAIPATLHAENINPHIVTEGTSFFINKSTKEWRQPIIDGQSCLRVGGISSFGFGGVNVHVVLQEYPLVESSTFNDYVIIPFSAKSLVSLRRSLEVFLAFLDKFQMNISLQDLAGTLLFGRAQLKERAAFIVNSLDELKQLIRSYLLSNESDFKGCNDQNLIHHVKAWMSKDVAVDWSTICRFQYRKISLPTYQFDKVRYWPEVSDVAQIKSNRNQFKVLSSEPWINDHKILDKIIMPGVGYIYYALEYCRAQHIKVNYPISFKDLTWLKPFDFIQSSQYLIIENEVIEADTLKFIFKDAQANKLASCQVLLQDKVQAPSMQKFDIDTFKKAAKKSLDGKNCYERFSKMGIHLGKLLKGIKTVYFNGENLLCSIYFSEVHPNKLIAVLDAALQSILILNTYEDDSKLYLPFSVKDIKLYKDLEHYNKAYIVAQKSEIDPKLINPTSDAYILDEHGLLIAEIKGSLGRPIVKPEIGLGLDFSYLNVVQHKIDYEVKNLPKQFTLFDMSKFQARAFKLSNDLIYTEYENIQGHDLESCLMKNVFLNDWIIVTYSSEQESGYYEQLIQNITQFIQIIYRLDRRIARKILLVHSNSDFGLYFQGFASYGLSLKKENPLLDFRVLSIYRGVDLLGWDALLSAMSSLYKVNFNYIGFHLRALNELYYESLVLTFPEKTGSFAIKKDGVYLITGGLGKLGKQFADYIAAIGCNSVVVSGRQEIADTRYDYVRMDLSKFDEVNAAIQYVLNKYGKIDGIIHSAGTIKDEFCYKKPLLDLLEVCDPKVQGTYNLDVATKDIKLDFFVCFSSLVSCLGNATQVDYAYANRYLDLFAEQRNHLVLAKKRYGHTLSISWGYWEHGGMKIPEYYLNKMQNEMGIYGIKKQEGFDVLHELLNTKYSHICVVYGDQQKFNRYFFNNVT